MTTSVAFRWTILTVLTIAAFALCAPTVTAQAEENRGITLDLIMQKWREREREMRSFDFQWEGQHFESGESFMPFVPIQTAKGSIPDATFNTRKRIAFGSRGRVRFEDESITWTPEKGEYGPKSTIDVFDETGHKRFFSHSRQGYPLYFLAGSNDDLVAKDLRTLPIRLAYRALTERIGVFDAKQLKLTDRTAVVGKDKVVILDYGAGEVWVSPDRNFMPVRYTIRHRGIDSIVVEISHVRDEAHGWFPDSWRHSVKNNKGEVYSSEADKVTRVSLNAEIPDSEFEIDVPVGTWVRNHLTDEVYIVRANEKRRPILKGEFKGTNYRELLNSEPGQVNVPINRWRPWIIGMNALAILLLVTALYHRRKSQHDVEP